MECIICNNIITAFLPSGRKIICPVDNLRKKVEARLCGTCAHNLMFGNIANIPWDGKEQLKEIVRIKTNNKPILKRRKG